MADPFALIDPFMPFFGPARPESGPAYWFIFSDSMLLLTRDDSGTLSLPRSRNCPVPEPDIVYQRLIARHDRTECILVGCSAGFDHQRLGFEQVGLRPAAELLNSELWLLAGRANQILDWHTDHLFCGGCGRHMEEQEGEAVKVCRACGRTAYPRLAPAVIMAVVRDDAILLGRAPRFPAGMYSTLAGFVEPGESLEAAVAREIFEEVSIRVTDIRYVASQPWPFPHSLMAGFHCRYLDGEIRVNHAELEDADWFTAARMPKLPPRISIARHLIERFLEDQERPDD